VSTGDSVNITVTGELNNGSMFEGFTSVKVIRNQAGGNPNQDSSGGSGGGGSVQSDEDFKNIEKQESRDAEVHIGPVLYKFTTLDILKEIGFDAKKNEGLVTAKFELLKGRPKITTSDVPGIVYRYFNAVVGTSGYGSSSRIENAYIVFNVPDEWLASNNVDSVKLMKNKNGSWIELETEKISPGTFKAYTLGFSGFAIVGKSSTLKESTIQPSKTSPAAEAVKETSNTERTDKPQVNLVLIMEMIIGIIILSVVYIKRRELFKK
jgi:PGF-pre-PGF domain-containing protein